MKIKQILLYQGSWMGRIIIYGVMLVVIFVVLSFYSQLKLAAHVNECMDAPDMPGDKMLTALNRVQRLAACIDQRSGLLERLLMRSTRETLVALPATPCRYIGVWSASRAQSVYEITLKDNSEFVAEPIRAINPEADTITGSWGVHQDKMVWFYNEGRVWPPDINLITPESASSFTLAEANGTRTHYALIEAVKSTSCAP